MLPQIAQGDSNKVWIIPSEFQQAIGRIGGALGVRRGDTSDGTKTPQDEDADRSC